MKIRKAKKGDFKEIYELIKIEYFKHYKEKWTKENTFKTLRFYDKVGKIFIVEIEKKVVGFVIIREEFYNGNKTLLVKELVVQGKVQGKGIGKKLMMFVNDYCRKNKIKSIWLITGRKVDAFKFYKKIWYKHEVNTAYFSKKLKWKRKKEEKVKILVLNKNIKKVGNI